MQSLDDEIARIHNKIVELDEQITFTQKMILSLKSGNKDDQLRCKILNADVITVSNKRKQLQTEHQKVHTILVNSNKFEF